MLKVLRPGLGRLLTPVGRALARTPLTPNMLTVIGATGMTAGALTLFPTGHLFAGTMVCTGFVVADMLDGTLARLQGSTGKFGAYLDSTMDRVADAAVFGGLTIWLATGGHSRLLACVTLFCLASGQWVSYAKARAEGLGVRCDVGIAERAERLIIGLVAAGLSGLGVPYVLSGGLWILAGLSAFTFGQRVFAVRRAMAEQADEHAESGPGGAAAAAPGEGAGPGGAAAPVNETEPGGGPARSGTAVA